MEQEEVKILVIADGAAFGAEMEKLMRLIKERPNVTLYLPESFEWLILKSKVVEAPEIYEILEHPEDYIESRDYFSWERFFTALLVWDTKDTHLRYVKRHLNPAYLQERVQNKILDVMDRVHLG